MLGWRKHKLESWSLGEISISLDVQMIPHLWLKTKKNKRASWWKWRKEWKIGLELNIQETKIMASGPITSWQIDGETMETMRDFILGGSKITADGDWSHEIKKHLLVVDGGVWSTFLPGVAFRHVICGFYSFSLPVRLPSKIQKLPPDPPVWGFPYVWKLPLLRLPSQDGSLSLALLSLFLSFIFCPTSFWRQWAAFLGAWCSLLAIRNCFVKFAQCSIVLLMNL